MVKFVIEGGKQLEGIIETNAGKNAPGALLFASLLLRGTAVFKNMTKGEEILRVLELFKSIGVSYEWQADDVLFVDTTAVPCMDNIDREVCERLRLSLLFMGALSSRVTSYKLYKTGGCKLGNRTIRPHLLALEKLGVHVRSDEEYYQVETKKVAGTKVVMYESGDTATENVILAAVLAEGTSVIKFASANYMVQDLCHFLVKAGAKIDGIGTTTLEIVGVDSLNSVDEYYINPDPVDAMAWISLAITSKSALTVKNCPIDFLELELEKLSIMGQKFDIKNERKSKSDGFSLVDIDIIPSDLTALPDKLYGRPYPGLNIDNVSLFIPILTQAKGRTLVHEWVYENRALYYLDFQKLGANIMLLDPHRVFVEGPTDLRGGEIICPPAIRPGMALMIGMLAAKGKSVLRNAYAVERGYDNLVERLENVGAKIQRIEE